MYSSHEVKSDKVELKVRPKRLSPQSMYMFFTYMDKEPPIRHLTISDVVKQDYEAMWADLEVGLPNAQQRRLTQRLAAFDGIHIQRQSINRLIDHVNEAGEASSIVQRIYGLSLSRSDLKTSKYHHLSIVPSVPGSKPKMHISGKVPGPNALDQTSQRSIGGMRKLIRKAKRALIVAGVFSAPMLLAGTLTFGDVANHLTMKASSNFDKQLTYYFNRPIMDQNIWRSTCLPKNEKLLIQTAKAAKMSAIAWCTQYNREQGYGQSISSCWLYATQLHNEFIARCAGLF